MKIDQSKLTNVVKQPDGKIVAQCPACAAAGGDTMGNHLAVFPNEKFSCVVNPKDKGHNKEILKLVGIADDQPPMRPKVKIRPHRVAPSTVICEVPRRTLEELGLVRDPNR